MTEDEWSDGIIDSMHMSLCKLQEDISLHKLQEIVKDSKPGMLQSIGSQRVRYNLAAEQHLAGLPKHCMFQRSSELAPGWPLRHN